MKVVLDTNVIISGLLWKGLPGKIFDLIDDGRVIFCITQNILREVDKVLRYPRIKSKLDSVGFTAEEITSYLVQVAEIYPDFPIRYKLVDRSDEKVLAAALTASADFLITGNKKHFQVESYENFEIFGIKIVTPREFLTEI